VSTAPLWTPDPARVGAAAITRFRTEIAQRHGAALDDYAALHRWSIEHPERFWDAVWEFCAVIGERGTGPALVDGGRMPGARFFPQARINFAENLLRRSDPAPALIFSAEDGTRAELSFAQLRGRVGALAHSLRELGLRPGERVAAYLPNAPETAIAMLATAALGGVFTSCSPDFGARGALDRFAQVEPAVLLVPDGYFYGGRRFDLREKVAELRAGLPGVRELIGVRFAGGELPAGALEFGDLVFSPREPEFERFEFNHPLYVLYSSGTTGRPKCIVHGAGGTLLQHLKEQRLHTDLGRDDRLFYFTTCGWMMWNWLLSGLACEASLVLYDGSPFHPGPERLFELAQRERISVFGTSAKYIDALAKSGLRPIETHDLASVKTLLSTGSPLSPESFRFVYEAVKRDVCLSSISGGTDLIGCFAAGNPAGPVYAGEAQVLALGMDVAAFDPAGHALDGERGELVCRRPFPSMPLGFWGDADGSRYRAAYFERFPNCWHHGDWIEITARGGMVIYGRSDAVLNPGGVRIGTAEIYRPVERIAEIAEALVIGQDWQGDVRVVLFVRLREGAQLDAALEARIRDAVRREASPRHVPARILAVPDIPRTRSGKIVELAVRDVVHGRPLANLEALANPEALEHFRDRPELAS